LSLFSLIGGVIILSTVGNDHSEINAVCAVIVVGLLHRVVAQLKQRFPGFGRLVDGTPLVLIKNGQWQTEVMDHMPLQETDVMGGRPYKRIEESARYRVRRAGTQRRHQHH